MANDVDPDQTAPIGAVCSGSTLFASILNSSVMLGNYLQQTTFSDAVFFLALQGLVFPLLCSSEPKAHGRAISIPMTPASIVHLKVVCLTTFSNISDETAEPTELKFHMENSGTEVYSNGPGHMTKMATMHKYG